MFYINSTCPHGKQYAQLYNDIFTCTAHEIGWYYGGEWRETSSHVKQFSTKIHDPHGCRDSCSEPGPQCLACTNDHFFQCPRSGICIHPNLRCDGHPQCEFGEDENAELCFERWVQSKIISPFGTLSCSSRRYPGTPTVATVCDGIVECSDGSDESSCTKQMLSNYLLTGAIVFIVMLYLALKYSRKQRKQKLSKQTMNIEIEHENKPSMELILENFETKRNSAETVSEVNTYLFHILHSRKTEEARKIFKKFFEQEARIYDNDEARIFLSLHQHLDPALVAPIVDAKTPGFTEKITDFFETLFCSKWITMLKDKITATEWLSDLIATVFTIVKIVASFADVFKDVFLTVSLIVMLGGPFEVVKNGTQFTSVVVMILIASIPNLHEQSSSCTKQSQHDL